MSYLNVLISFLALSFIVFIHELGHFLFCRLFGVVVEVFSVGFGGSIFSYRDKHNTEWVFGWITFGGYVMPLESIKKVSSSNSSAEGSLPLGIGMEENHPLKNVLIAFSGPLFNFILSFFIIFILNLMIGSFEMKYEISQVRPASVAEFHGFQKGDFIIDVVTNENGKIVRGLKSTRIKDGSIVTILRKNYVIQKKISLGYGEKFQGLGFKYSYNKKNGVFSSFFDAVKKVFEMIFLALIGIVLVFKSLFLRLIGYGAEHLYMNISGTVGVVNATNNALKNGLADFLIIISQISVSLGAFNLLPIPILDGGQILINFVEWVIGHKINSKIRDTLFVFSFALMLALFVFSTFLDLYKLKLTF